MSAVNSSTFSNKKPNLTGTVTSDLTVNQALPTVAAAISCVSQAVNFTTVGSTGMTITFTKNEILLRGRAGFRMSSGNSMDVRIIRDSDTGDVLASTNTGVTTSGVWTLETTIIDETVGAHAYQWQIKMNSGQAETCCVENEVFFNIFSEANDTHNTKNANIIGG